MSRYTIDICTAARSLLNRLNAQRRHEMRVRFGLAVSLLTIQENGGYVSESGRADIEELYFELLRIVRAA